MTVRIQAVVFNHNRRATAEKLFSQLSQCCDTALIDSGSTQDQISPLSTHAFSNLYWTGCWNKSFELFPDADVLWGIGGDCSLVSPAQRYLEAIEELYPFGIWSPTVAGRAHEYMQPPKIGAGYAYTVQFIEGIAFAISRQLRQTAGAFPAENYLGHGQDLLYCWASRQNNLKNVLDARLKLTHPPSYDYDVLQAKNMMFESLSKAIGEDWQDIIDWWWGRTISFEANAISRIEMNADGKRYIRPFLRR